MTTRSRNTYNIIVIRACAPRNGIAALVLNKSCHASDGHENSSRACIIRVRHDIKPGVQRGKSNTGKISPRVKFTRNIECHDGMLDVEERTGVEGHETYAVEVVARALAIEHARGGVVEKAGGEVGDAKHLHTHKSRPFSAAFLTGKMLCSLSPCETTNSFVCSTPPIFIPRNAAHPIFIPRNAAQRCTACRFVSWFQGARCMGGP